MQKWLIIIAVIAAVLYLLKKAIHSWTGKNCQDCKNTCDACGGCNNATDNKNIK